MTITKGQLRRLTDDGSWERGVGYFRQGRVRSLLRDGDRIDATVSGTRDYRVVLRLKNGKLDGECSCPMGEDGVFCKHCVAVGLTYLDAGAEGDEQAARVRPAGRRSKPARRVPTAEDLRAYLSRQEKPALVETIIEQARRDEDLLHRLSMKAALFSPDGPDLAVLRAAIDKALSVDGYVDYHSVSALARGVLEIAGSLAELLDAGHAAEAIELTEYALRGTESVAVDGPDGWMDEVFERLWELHHAACVAARPDPGALARHLFEWGAESGHYALTGAAQIYADVLGAEGMAVYRKLAEAEWAKVSAIGPGGEHGPYEDGGYEIASIMESLALADGDLDAYVAVKSRDLSSPWVYLEIAEAYRTARKWDKVAEWARRGLEAFPKSPDPRLRELLANEYHRRRRHDEAMELVWADFADRADLGGYRRLKSHADRAGQWPQWRKRALEHVHKSIGQARKQARRDRSSWAWGTDHSLLVEIYLWEGDAQSAWDEARVGGCSEGLWTQLARRREKDHPEDALSVYLRRVEPIVERTHRSAYREAVGLLRKIRRLMKRLGRQDEFAEIVDGLRTKYKRKRSFIAMLEALS